MIEFRVLGPIGVVRDGEPVDLGSRKQRTVLAVLIAHVGHVVSADRIIEAVWGEDATPGNRRSLQTYVSNLRRLLDPTKSGILNGSPDGYRLVPPAGSLVDWVAFTGSRSGESGDAMTEALALWRGDPFENVENEWARPLTTAWQEQRLAMIEAWADLVMEDGRTDPIPSLERAVGANPLRESLWERLMRALVAAGRPAEALTAYRRLVQLLGEEMGIEPSPEIRALEERILLEEERARPRRRRSGSGSLPVDRTPLIGRDGELVAVGELMAHHRLVSLLGPGGSGKTRLAIAAARRLNDESDTAVAFVDLTPLSDASQVPAAVASALGIVVGDELATGRSVVEQVTEALAQREVLIVLDNCEHVIEGATEVADELLRTAPAVSIIATSREALEIPGEQRHQVPPLSLSDEDENPALALFVQRAGEASDRFAPSGDELAVLGRVCQALEGMPLAIELAAAQTAYLSPNELASTLGDRLTMSAGRRREGRHQTLAATMDWSWELLGADERLLLGEVSVFSGGWTLAAAAGVCTGTDAAVRETLRALVAKSLIQVDQGVWGSRFRLLDTVRLYALDKLGSEAAQLRRRHANWFSEWAASWSVEDHWTSGELASRQFADNDNLRTALFAHVEAGDMSAATWIVSACSGLWRANHAAKEALEWTGAIDPTQLADELRVLWLLARGTAVQISDDFPGMWDLAEEAAGVARRVARSDLVAVALATGAFGYLVADLNKNAQKWEEVLRLTQDGGTQRVEAAAWAMLAIGRQLRGGPVGDVDALMEHARSLVGPEGWDQAIVALAEVLLGIAAGRTGDVTKPALDRLETVELLNIPMEEARSRLLLAYAAASAGEGDLWEDALRRAHERYITAWGSRAHPDVLFGIAAWEIFQGDAELGAELMAVVRNAGPEYPETWVEYVQVRDIARRMLGRDQIDAARARARTLTVDAALAREFTRLGWE